MSQNYVHGGSGHFLRHFPTFFVNIFRHLLGFSCEFSGLSNKLPIANEVLGKRQPKRIVFIVTIEGWHFRPQDKATVELVLEAIEGVNLEDKYAVVANKASLWGPCLPLHSLKPLT